MATKAVSPGGALLRASRLFSLPAQLPAPTGDVTGATLFHSETATAAFPTLQSVITPETSRKRGDWGFKRSLPWKSTSKTTTPVIRVKHVDSTEQVTDFGSAADHTLSLQKWLEMKMPITTQSTVEATHGIHGKSVFEDIADVLAHEPGKPLNNDNRWRFQGPWLAGMTRGDFQRYLKIEVRTKRIEFRQFLRERLAAKINEDAAQKAQDAGKDMPAPMSASDITESQLLEYLRKLRNSESRQTLYNIVGKFLDLAPLQPHEGLAKLGALSPVVSKNPYAKEGPPVTHPSAGISYLRTGSYLDNHPLYGPQKLHPPVAARVVSPQGAGGFAGAQFGVGGFITDSPDGDTAYNIKGRSNHFNPKEKGGSKHYVHPAAAKISSSGRVMLTLQDGDAEAALVQRELEGGTRIFGKPLETRMPMGSRPFQGRRARQSGQNTIMGSSQSYGMGSPSRR